MSELELLASMLAGDELTMDRAAEVVGVSHSTLRRRALLLFPNEPMQDQIVLPVSKGRPVTVSASDLRKFLDLLAAEPSLKSPELRRVAAAWRARQSTIAGQGEQRPGG
jgi:hypothetical protein